MKRNGILRSGRRMYAPGWEYPCVRRVTQPPPNRGSQQTTRAGARRVKSMVARRAWAPDGRGWPAAADGRERAGGVGRWCRPAVVAGGWARQGSNLRPGDYESLALTTELRARAQARPRAPRERPEPSPKGLTVECTA